MPLIRGFKQEEEDKKKKLGAQPLQQPGLGAAPAQAAPTPQTQAASQALGGQTSVQGGNFINLKDYLNANEGQGKAMADKVGGGIEGKAKGVAGAQAVQNISTIGATAPTAPAQPEWQESSVAWANSGRMPKEAVQAVAPRQQQMNNNLTGQAEYDAAKSATDAANLLGSEGGKTELLDQAYGTGRSSGESDFDNALMGAGGGGKLNDLKNKYSGLAQWVQDDQTGKATAARDAQTDAADFKTKYDSWATQGAAAAQSGMEGIQAETERQRRAKMSERELWQEAQDGARKKDPAKRSWDDYSKFDPGRAVYDAHRAANPIDWVADAAGWKNPIDGMAAEVFDPTNQHDRENNYSNMIDFGAVLPGPISGPDFQKRMYESMTEDEIKQVGKMSRNDQRAWVIARAKQLGWEF